MRDEQRLRVLVVEDDEDSRSLYAEILQERFEVSCAADGEQGWEAFVKEKPDLIITDQSLPGLTGTELAQKVKEVAPGAAVVLITGHSGVEHGGSCDLVLEKPIDLDELSKAIEAVSEKTRNRTE
jgi:DNA-binding NtrC family response regulator